MLRDTDVAVAGLVTMAILSGAMPKRIAQDVTLEVWSHEADEPAKVAFRELAALKSREVRIPGSRSRSPGTKKIPCLQR